MLPQASVTEDGTLRVTTDAPTPTDTAVGGVKVTEDGRIHVSGNTPQVFDQGKGFMLNGDLCVDTTGGAVAGHVGGLPVTATGALKCQVDQPVSPGDVWVGGIRVGELGGIYVTEGGGSCIPISIVTAPTITGTGEVGTKVFFGSSGTYAGTPPLDITGHLWYVGASSQGGGASLDILPGWVGQIITAVETAENACGSVSNPSNGIEVVDVPGWTPDYLYLSGELGGYFDLTDIDNMFQDPAMTTPVTGIGQPIGAVVDQGPNGWLITQDSAARKPVLGRMPATGVRNLMAFSEDYANPLWDLWDGALKTPDYDGPGTCRVQLVNAGSELYRTLGYAGAQGTTVSLLVKSTSGADQTVRIRTYVGGNSFSSNFVVGAEYTRVFFGETRSGLELTWALATGSGGAPADVVIKEAQAEAGALVTAYQTVGEQWDVTEAGQPSVYAPWFDGVDDVLTGPLSMTGANQVTVFAGTYLGVRQPVLSGIIGHPVASAGPSYFDFYAPSSSSQLNAFVISTPINAASVYYTQTAPAANATVALGTQQNIRIWNDGVAGTVSLADNGPTVFGDDELGIGISFYGFITTVGVRGLLTSDADRAELNEWVVARTPGVRPSGGGGFSQGFSSGFGS